MKFIHAADIHLDSPLLGLERYEGAPAEELRGASRQAFENLIRLAIDEGAAFVLIAGDLFDGDWRDYNTGLYFVRQMAELKKQGIAVFIVSGNHDAASQITRALSLPDNVHFFGSRAPETVVVEGLGVAIHGQSYRTPELTDNLAMGYPDGVTGRFNIGLLHTAATGRPGHASYAPCTLDHLLAKGYDYWALGHVHKREELNRAPWVVYAGNTQGRHARETGAKGCTLVTVADGAATAVEHRDLDVVRWAQVQVECSDLDSPRAALTAAVEQLAEATAAAKGRLLATRVEFVGRSRAHSRLLREEEQWRNELRGMCLGSFGDRVWIEKILFRTAMAIDLGQLAAGHDPVALLLRGTDDAEEVKAVLADERQGIDAILAKIPVELRSQLELPDLDDPEQVQQLFAEIREMLLPLIVAGEEGA